MGILISGPRLSALCEARVVAYNIFYLQQWLSRKALKVQVLKYMHFVLTFTQAIRAAQGLSDEGQAKRGSVSKHPSTYFVF
jgi:hypothetical protein